VTDPVDLTCAEAVELMTTYLEGGLDEAERERFEHHLALCVGCDVYLEQLRQTIVTAGSLARPDLPRPLRDGLRAAFRDWRAGG
jgi:anti-sigma factor RsiW